MNAYQAPKYGAVYSITIYWKRKTSLINTYACAWH